MNRKSFIFFAVYFFPLLGFSQYAVRGTVISGEDSSPLPAVAISNSHDSVLTFTDENGAFYLQLKSPETLTFQHLGFATQQLRVSEEADNYTVKLDPVSDILDEVKVISFESDRSLREVAGGIGVVKESDFKQFDQTSLVPAMNQIPGVRMEQRSTGSYRISIRGSALRAPFDVRNVKVYWNNIPFTEPGGNTPFNLFDNINFSRIEVIKGPAGSIYGAGIGGVINIKSLTPAQEKKSLSSSLSVGSYGTRRYTLSGNFGDDKKAVRFSYAKQKVDGYRNHSALDRKNFALNAAFETGENSQLSTDILYSDLFYEIPGGLNQEQYDQDPKQARPGNPFVLGSEDANASINVKNLLAGISFSSHLGSRADLLTTVYTNSADFINPFNLDYKREAQQGYGGRTRANIYGSIKNIETKLIIGAEYQYRIAAARNYGNNYGKPDTLNFDDELRTTQYMFFGQYEVFLPSDWIFTAGLSASNVVYDIHRITDSKGANGTKVNKNFETQWMPRISLLKAFDNTSLYGSISYGFSPPTLEEVRTNEGSINLDLEPEKGINFEAGIRGDLNGKRISYDLTAFYLKLSESIVDYPSDRGTDLFENAGNIDQYGLEAAIVTALVSNKYSFVSALELTLNYSYHYFLFDSYIIPSEGDYSDKALPGVAPNTIWAGVNLENRSGFYLNVNYNYTDEIPLNNANSVYAQDYHLVLGKLGFRNDLTESLFLDVYVGGDNLLNERYSLGNDLNAFGDRFFQPAPERNYYSGISLNYTF